MSKEISGKTLSVSVAMITKNEEKSVGKVITDIKKYAPNSEILIVDSSEDRTAQIAEKFGARVIRQFPPKGYGKAMDLALRSAKGDIVVTLDCDDTYPAQYIPLLASFVEEGYDLADGNRLWRKPEAMALLNYAANRFFALVARIILGFNFEDLHSGMRAYRASMLKEMKFNIVGKGNALPVELLLKPARLGYKVIQVPITYRMRIGETTLEKWDSAKWTVIRIMNVRKMKSKK